MPILDINAVNYMAYTATETYYPTPTEGVRYTTGPYSTWGAGRSVTESVTTIEPVGGWDPRPVSPEAAADFNNSLRMDWGGPRPAHAELRRSQLAALAERDAQPPLAPYPESVPVGDWSGQGESPLQAARADQAVRARYVSADTETSRQQIFMDNVNDAVRNDRDLGFAGRRYLKGLKRGELLQAARAYEHVRPELWPFGTARRFDAVELSVWRRLARAVAFLELECKRLDDPHTEDHKDAVHEIRRLTTKALEYRWPSQQEVDPF